jgi:hypothetical protein
LTAAIKTILMHHNRKRGAIEPRSRQREATNAGNQLQIGLDASGRIWIDIGFDGVMGRTCPLPDQFAINNGVIDVDDVSKHQQRDIHQSTP